MKNTSSLSEAQKRNILEERARFLARTPENESLPEDIHEVITFHNGSEYFGFSTKLIFETQPLSALKWAKVPGAPSFILGIVNLRGHIYSIMDLACFWGHPRRPITEQAHLLLAQGGYCDDGKAMELTFITDDVPQIYNVPFGDLKPVPAVTSYQIQKYAQGITSDMLMIINLERLLSDPNLIIQVND